MYLWYFHKSDHYSQLIDTQAWLVYILYNMSVLTSHSSKGTVKNIVQKCIFVHELFITYQYRITLQSINNIVNLKCTYTRTT